MLLRQSEGRNPFVNQVFGVLYMEHFIQVVSLCRNPFVNQVFGVARVFSVEEEKTLTCRNPFVNQVFGVRFFSEMD